MYQDRLWVAKDYSSWDDLHSLTLLDSIADYALVEDIECINCVVCWKYNKDCINMTQFWPRDINFPYLYVSTNIYSLQSCEFIFWFCLSFGCTAYFIYSRRKLHQFYYLQETKRMIWIPAKNYSNFLLFREQNCNINCSSWDCTPISLSVFVIFGIFVIRSHRISPLSSYVQYTFLV